MSVFAYDFDPRFSVRFFEVHFWPATGRVLTINADGGKEPILADITITVSGATVSDTAFLVALALCDAGSPVGTLVEHESDGRTWAVDPAAGFSRTPYATA